MTDRWVISEFQLTSFILASNKPEKSILVWEAAVDLCISLRAPFTFVHSTPLSFVFPKSDWMSWDKSMSLCNLWIFFFFFPVEYYPKKWLSWTAGKSGVVVTKVNSKFSIGSVFHFLSLHWVPAQVVLEDAFSFISVHMFFLNCLSLISILLALLYNQTVIPNQA